MSEFGRLLKRHRSRLPGAINATRFGAAGTGLSQNALARRAGIDPAYVNRFERHGAIPTREVVDALADALVLADGARDELLMAAGYWPWPGLDAAALRAVLLVGGQLAARPPARLEAAS